MEIIHLILGKANPNRMNGVNKVVYQLASNQARTQRRVSVWGITKSLEHNYDERNFETKLFQAMKNPFLLNEILKEALLTKKKQAIFHLHGGWIPAYSSLSKYLFNNNIPFVLTPHGAYNTIAMKRSSFIKKIYFRFFEAPLLKRVSKIHCIGKSEIEGLRTIFPNTKSILLPYGFDAFKAAIQVKKQQENFIIGFIGRLDIYTKGLDLLLDAFEKFRQNVPHAKLWIIGDSNEKEKLEELIITKNLINEVILWGSKFGKEKEALLLQMDVFAHPSRNEGLPSSVLEASCMGVPCVVSEATNMGAYIQEMGAGKVVKNENVHELANAFTALYELHKKNELQVLSKNAIKMVHTFFNWDTVVNSFDKLYE
ncbi:MAG: glycosyltransferase family 4 protein [Flavobacteriaceae bacterium]|nr:glycosyltransferase family 4 protein [Flavobacteriaceae bacterium]